MARGLILETTLLIDFERELAQAMEGPVHRFLEMHAAEPLFITPTIAGELAAGASLGDRRRWEQFVAPFHLLPHTRDVAWEYGSAFRYLQANGLLIGANDLWIAAAGLAYELPVATRNDRHYARVPGLEVLSYTSG